MIAEYDGQSRHALPPNQSYFDLFAARLNRNDGCEPALEQWGNVKGQLMPGEHDTSDPDQCCDCTRSGKSEYDVGGAMTSEMPKNERNRNGDESQRQASAPDLHQRAGRKVDNGLEHNEVIGCEEGAADDVSGLSGAVWDGCDLFASREFVWAGG